MEPRDHARRVTNRRDRQEPQLARAGSVARGRAGAIVFRTSDTAAAYPTTAQAYHPVEVVDIVGPQHAGQAPEFNPLPGSTGEIVANVGGGIIPRGKLGIAVQIDGVLVTQWG